MKDRIRAILKEWLQVKDAVIFTDDIAIEAVTEEIDDAILEMYGTLPSDLLKQNKELMGALELAVSVMTHYETLYNAAAERNAIKVAEQALKNSER